jgi:hypothetical protein
MSCPIPVGNHHEPFLGQNWGGMKFRGSYLLFIFSVPFPSGSACHLSAADLGSV